MEDLLQNLFLEMATNGPGGEMNIRGGPPQPVAAQMLGEIMGEMMGARGRPGGSDDDEDEHEAGGNHEREENDHDSDGDGQEAFMMNMLANAMMAGMPFGNDDDDEHDFVGDDEDFADDSDNLSEIS
jgi:hypothetical protein